VGPEGALAGESNSAVAAAVAALTPSTASLRELSGAFRRAMARGLAGEPSSLKMLPAFVGQPRGDERGRVAVVDWGGTRGRVALIELGAGGETRIRAEDDFAFSEADKTGPAERVFDVIAASIARIAGADASLPVGFVYSFPARLEAIDRAFALSLTKGWRVEGLVGQDVVALLQVALGRRGLDRIRVAAVANDTVATLMLASFRARGRRAGARPAEVGLILGTGTNQAADLPGAGIRNLESGNFDGVDGVDTEWDRAIDRALTDPAPGAQRFEKMAAGHYLGEITRRAAEDIRRSAPLFSWPEGALAAPFALDGEAVSAIAGDRSPDLSDVDAVLRRWGIASARPQREALRALARAVGTRAARLIAAALLGPLTFIDPDLANEHTVGVDGSVYGGYPRFADLVRDGLRELVGVDRASRLHLSYVEDATAAGVAVIAAVAAGTARPARGR